MWQKFTLPIIETRGAAYMEVAIVARHTAHSFPNGFVAMMGGGTKNKRKATESFIRLCIIKFGTTFYIVVNARRLLWWEF